MSSGDRQLPAHEGTLAPCGPALPAPGPRLLPASQSQARDSPWFPRRCLWAFKFLLSFPLGIPPETDTENRAAGKRISPRIFRSLPRGRWEGDQRLRAAWPGSVRAGSRGGVRGDSGGGTPGCRASCALPLSVCLSVSHPPVMTGEQRTSQPNSARRPHVAWRPSRGAV